MSLNKRDIPDCSRDNYFGDSAVSKILVTRCHFSLFPPIAAKEKTTSEAILTATSQPGCSLIPGTAFCEVLEANRPGVIIDEVMKNLGNYTSAFVAVVVVVVVGNYSYVGRNFNKLEKKVW